MRLKKFRIKNYKSINDSGWCWLAYDITVLAGKNESGKSAVLEALRDFNKSEKITEDARPLDEDDERDDPSIELCFDVSKEILNDVVREVGFSINNTVRAYIFENGLSIIKNADNTYTFEDDFLALLVKHTENKSKQSEVSEDADKDDEGVNESEEGSSSSASIKRDSKEKDVSSVIDKLMPALLKRAPKFIFFSDFSDILPFEILLSKIRSKKIVGDFAKIAYIDFAKINDTKSAQRRRNMLSKKSAKFNDDFGEDWKQDQIELIAEIDGENLRFGVKEAGKTILFQSGQRSKGFQWFLSFYLRLNSEQDASKIILIDEPGLYLHAKAQQDTLKVLEKISKQSQVIFSTHSPYLIDTNRFDRVRLILKKDETGTCIENKIHKTADKETLTPIITAIGLDILNDLSISKGKNVLLEGISDYYFLQALRNKCSEQTNGLNFIPCVGAPQIPQLASLFIGWGLPFVVVLDKDTAGKNSAKKLTENLAIESKKVIFVSEAADQSIEDLFTSNDFNKYVLNGEKSKPSKISNSDFLKQESQIDKVLLSKKFFEKMQDGKEEVELSEDTIKNFGNLLDRINKSFSS